MEATTTVALTEGAMLQPIASGPLDSCKDIVMEPLTKVEHVLSNRIQEAVALDDEDDDCVICYATLYRPVKTECGHSACEACMLHWALTAMDQCADSAELPSNLTVDGIKFRCPTCRTYTTATYNSELDGRLRNRYPDEYAVREKELMESQEKQQDESGVQTMLVMLGNSHRKVEPTISPQTGIMSPHEWTFFLKSSRPEVVEQVQIVLHPYFRENRLIRLRQPPFSTTQLSAAYFTVTAGVQLKKGYEWVEEPRASDSCHDRKNDRLPFEWLLDFRGNGSQASKLYKFRKVEEEAVEPEEDLEDLSVLAEFMSEAEIEELKQVRRLKKAATRLQETLEIDEP